MQEIDFSQVVAVLLDHMHGMRPGRSFELSIYNTLPESRAASGAGLVYNERLLAALLLCTPCALIKPSVLQAALMSAIGKVSEVPLAVVRLREQTGTLQAACAQLGYRIRVMLAHLRRLKDITRWRQCVRNMLASDRECLRQLVDSVRVEHDTDTLALADDPAADLGSSGGAPVHVQVAALALADAPAADLRSSGRAPVHMHVAVRALADAPAGDIGSSGRAPVHVHVAAQGLADAPAADISSSARAPVHVNMAARALADAPAADIGSCGWAPVHVHVAAQALADAPVPCTEDPVERTSLKRRMLAAQHSDASQISLDERGWPLMTQRKLCHCIDDDVLLKRALSTEPLPVRKQEVKLHAKDARDAQKKLDEDQEQKQGKKGQKRKLCKRPAGNVHEGKRPAGNMHDGGHDLDEEPGVHEGGKRPAGNVHNGGQDVDAEPGVHEGGKGQDLAEPGVHKQRKRQAGNAAFRVTCAKDKTYITRLLDGKYVHLVSFYDSQSPEHKELCQSVYQDLLDGNVRPEDVRDRRTELLGMPRSGTVVHC